MSTLYLSKIQLDPALLHDAYRLHQALWDLFPGRPEARRTFLYRLETPRPQRRPMLLLQSAEPPDATAAKNLRVADGPKGLALAFSRDQRLRFRLSANPVKRLNATRDRVPLIDDGQRLAWLRRKLEGAAEIEHAVVAGARLVQFRKGRQIGTIAIVEFDGILRVTDPDALHNLLTQGIGAAKAFGCGLLSLARP